MPWLDHTRYWATVGLRVEPGPLGSGGVFTHETELGALPRAFHQAVEETVHATLRTGLSGAAVTDYRVTLTRSGYSSPVSTAADFRGLTPIVLRRALRRAGTRLYEPYHCFEAEVPADALAAVTARLAALGADFTGTTGGAAAGTDPRGGGVVVPAQCGPSAEAAALTRRTRRTPHAPSAPRLLSPGANCSVWHERWGASGHQEGGLSP